jgi:DNA-binding CsgD family transcriptional regulator
MSSAQTVKSLLDDQRFMTVLSVIQAFCGTVFAIDIAYEAHIEFVNGEPAPLIEFVHVGLEVLAVALLFIGFMLTRRHAVRLQKSSSQSIAMLGSLRGHFDDIILARFRDWQLSAAESDIALLSLRGMSIHEIAEMRHTREGTIKAQLSAIYRKSGLANRTEVLAYFMDDFIDFGASDPNSHRA